jgi:hypothetical protein
MSAITGRGIQPATVAALDEAANAGRRRLSEQSKPPRAEVDPAAASAGRCGAGDAVEAVASDDNAERGLLSLISHDDRLVQVADRHNPDAEPDLSASRAERVDEIGHQQLLRVDVMHVSAQRLVVKHVPRPGAAELARPDGLAPRQHPTGQAVALEQPGGAVLDQARPRSRADSVLGQALENNTADASPDQNVGREQPRRPRSHDAHIAHDQSTPVP